jgi:Phytanoyl-CoA dioxygenase (PhyH)
MLDSLEQTNQCKYLGYGLLQSVFSKFEIEEFRTKIAQSIGMMGQTRSVSHSYHLAGFHRFPSLSTLHGRIVDDQIINGFLSGYFEQKPYYAIGLSDITINRSQQWHTDLLRGQYAGFLAETNPWSPTSGSCLKALIYLQDGESLQIVPRSHTDRSPLDDNQLANVAETMEVIPVKVKAGDVVMMDIRILHRGSTDEAMSDPSLKQSPKILISTVFGPIASEFAQAMQIGNAHRTADWDRKFLK